MNGSREGIEQFDDAADASIRRGPSAILWDLVGSCSLRCPSCAIGNMPGGPSKGVIDEALFDRILEKLDRGIACRQLHFYNWTEPLIHPRIVTFCRAAVERGYHLHLSSNLNYLKDEEELLAAGVKTLRVSLSGFSQAVYERGHRGGDVERVKANMRRLSEAKQRTGSLTRMHVYYHKYRHNLHELEAMKAFAEESGFDFMTTWAFYMPLENLVRYAEETLPDEHRRFADEAILPSVGSSLELMQRHRDRDCEIIDQLVMDCRGDVSLCCATYEPKTSRIGNFLDLDWADIQRVRFRHETCRRCMQYGAHVLYTYFDKPELNEAMERLAGAQLACQPGIDTGDDVSLPVLPMVVSPRRDHPG